MANQQNSYTGSQGTGTNNADFSFTFPSFTTSEVKVEVDNVVKTLTTHYTVENYNTTSGGKVRFTAGNIPTGTTPVRIFRQTDVDSAKATFTAGASLKAAEINDNFKQVRHALQEAIGAVATDRKVQRFNIEADTIDGTLIADDVIDSEHYVAGSIDHEHLGNDIIDGSNIQDDVINSEHYVAGSIDEEHLANSAVTQNKLANNSVGTPEIINGSVTTDKLANDNVTLAKLGGGALPTDITVASANIVDGTITTADIGGDQITNALIADNQIDSEHYIDGSIDHVHLANDIIDGDNIQDDVVNSEHIAAGALDNEHYAAGSITSDKLSGATVVTNSEQSGYSVNDTSFFTTSAAEARYFNASTGETIKDGQTFPDNDTTIATTAAINDRIIDLVDDVGGFVPIANETSFPTANPDVNNGAGTLVSIKEISSTRTPSTGTVTIANGSGSNTVTITGCGSTVLTAGFGVIVETTTTLHTYAFHRLVPKATEVTTVAGKATEIGRLGTAAAVEDLSILGTADVVADLNTLGTADVVADMNMLAVSDVISDMNTLAVTSVINDMDTVATNVTNVNNVSGSISNVNTTAGSISNVNTVAGSISNVNTVGGSISNVNTTAGSISNVNSVASNMANVNNFADRYQIASNNPSTDGGGNALAAGDLYFNTSANELKVYNGSSWQAGVTATGNFALTTGNTFTGDNRYNDNVKALFGTGSDLEIFHNGTNSHLRNQTGDLIIDSNSSGSVKLRPKIGEEGVVAITDGAVQLYYDGSKKFETTSTGTTTTGDAFLTDTIANEPRFRIETSDGGSKRFDLFIDSNAVATISAQQSAQNIAINARNQTIFSRGGSGSESESMRIDASGNVGIGETAPANLLHVKVSDTGVAPHGSAQLVLERSGTNYLQFLTAADGTSGLLFGDANDADVAKIVYDHNVPAMQFVTETAERMRIDSSGNVGIGITNPASTLHLDASGGAVIQLQRTSSNASNRLLISHDGTDATLESSNATLFRNNGAERMRITSGGNLGIGGTAPNYQLHATTSIGVGAHGFNQHLSIDNDGIQSLVLGTGYTTLNLNQLGGNVDIANDSSKLRLGAGNDLTLYHDGSQNYIDTIADRITNIRADILVLARLNGDKYAKFTAGGSSELYYAGNKKFETDSLGTIVTGRMLFGDSSGVNDHTLKFGDSGDLLIYHDGSNSYVDNNTGTLNILAADELRLYVNDNEYAIKAVNNGAVELYHNNTKTFETDSTGINVFGTSGNGIIDIVPIGSGVYSILNFHNVGQSSNAQIISVSGSSILMGSGGSGSVTLRTANSQNKVVCNHDGAVDLYHGSSKKFETTANGVEVTGDLRFDSSVSGGTIRLGDDQKLFLGGGDDLKIYHDGSHSYIEDAGTGNLRLLSNNAILANADTFTVNNEANSENMITAVNGGAVELFHDGSKKFETLSNGIEVSGHIYLADSNQLRLGNPGSNGDFRIDHDGTYNNIKGVGAHGTRFFTNNTERMRLTSAGVLQPGADDTYDLGTSSLRWRNVYTMDLHLSNKGKSNDVDSTWGDWTLQEGESDLFLKNNRSGKNYKINLTEVV